LSEKGPVLSRQQGAIRELARAVRLVRAGRSHVWLCGVCTVGCLSSSVPPAEGDSAPGASRTDEYTTQGQGPAAPMLRVRAVSPCRPAPQRHATEHGIWPGCSSPSACDANAIARSPVPGPVAPCDLEAACSSDRGPDERPASFRTGGTGSASLPVCYPCVWLRDEWVGLDPTLIFGTEPTHPLFGCSSDFGDGANPSIVWLSELGVRVGWQHSLC